MKQNKTLTVSVPFPLGVLFIILKMVGVITWPWIWVLAPFWIPVAFLLALLLAIGLSMGVMLLFGAILKR